MDAHIKYLSKPLVLYVNLCYTNTVVEQHQSTVIYHPSDERELNNEHQTRQTAAHHITRNKWSAGLRRGQRLVGY